MPQNKLENNDESTARGEAPAADDQRQAPTVTVVGWLDAVPDDVRSYWHHVCGEASLLEHLPAGPATRPLGFALEDNVEIWRVPCRSAAYGLLCLVFFRSGGTLEGLTVPYGFNGIEPRPRYFADLAFQVGTQVAIQPAVGSTGVLSLRGTEHLPSGAEDRDQARWVWNGRWFEAAQVLELPAAPGGWTAKEREAILLAVRATAGFEAPGMSQFEDLLLQPAEPAPNCLRTFAFSYCFDQDGHSQYDETIRTSGVAGQAADGHWQVLEFRVDHVGEAARYPR